MTNGHRILVVEDNELNLKLVRDVLNHAGYEVVEARTGEQGVELAAECRPDLVLMDLQLPGIDGIEALRQLRASPWRQGVPVVAVTAFAMREDRERAVRAGFDGYMEKPFSIRELPGQVRRFLSTEAGMTDDDHDPHRRRPAAEHPAARRGAEPAWLPGAACRIG